MLTHGDDCSIIMMNPTHEIKNFIDKCINSVNACKEFAAHSDIKNESRVRQNRFQFENEDLYDESVENYCDGEGDYEPESESDSESESEDEDEDNEKKSKKDTKRKRKTDDENLNERPPKKIPYISSRTNDDYTANCITTTNIILLQEKNDEAGHSNNAEHNSDILNTTIEQVSHDNKKDGEQLLYNDKEEEENLQQDNYEKNINLPREYQDEKKEIMELNSSEILFREDNYVAFAETFQRIIQNRWLERSLVDYCIRDALNAFLQKNKIKIDLSPHVCSLSTYMDQKSLNSNDENEIVKKKYVYIPIFEDNHFWLVCIVNHQDEICAIVFDSLYSSRKKFYSENGKHEFQSKIIR